MRPRADSAPKVHLRSLDISTAGAVKGIEPRVHRGLEARLRSVAVCS